MNCSRVLDPVRKRVLLSLMALCLFKAVALYAGEACDVKVVSPHATVFGRTLGDWGAEWWKWAFSVPTPKHPVTDPTGQYWHEGQAPEDVVGHECRQSQGSVIFLAGNFGGTTQRTITIPCGKWLFFPIVNTVFWAPTDCQGCPECTQAATDKMNEAKDLACEIDDQPIDLVKHLEVSATCFCFKVPLNNPFGLPEGIYTPVATAGYVLMIEPLCPGVHTIHFSGNLGATFHLDVTYLNLTVQPGCVFKRGDVNADGAVNIADAVCCLGYLFGRADDPCKAKVKTCLDAVDANNDGDINIADAIKILGHLFAREGPLPDPFATCGIDPSADGLGCDRFEPCE